MTDSPTNGDRVKAANRTLEIFEILHHSDGARVSEVAQEVDVAKSTAHRYLKTLHEKGYLIKKGDIHYLSFRFLELGSYTRTRKKVYLKAQEKVQKLADETNERIQFVVEEHGKGVFVFTNRGDFWDRDQSRVGHRIDLHASGSGKAILASLPEQRVKQIITDHGLEQKTANTITDYSNLKSELEQIRERGYAFNDEENLIGMRSVGAPVVDKYGHVFGSISCSGPKHRLQGDLFCEEIPDLLLQATNEIELYHHDQRTH